MRKRDIRVGVPVVAQSWSYPAYFWSNRNGEIVVIHEDGRVGVAFEEASDIGHHLDGACPPGHGYWASRNAEGFDRRKGVPARRIPKPPPDDELAWFDYCDQLEGALSRTDEEAKHLFLAGWEAALRIKGGGA